MEAITELDLNLLELLEAASVQGVPGSEVMPNTTVSRQTLASTSSFASDDSYQSDSGSANPDSGFSCILDQFSDIGQLLAEHNQDTSSELQPSTLSEGRHGNYGTLGSDEIMWNPSHSSSSPAIPTTALEPQTDTNDRASVSADMGNSPSPDRVHDSGPAAKRARLSSDESITSVLNDLERKREKNNEACRRARQNKRAKELEMKEKAQTLEKENEKLRKTIAKLEKKVSEEKARFLKAMTTS